MLTEALQGILIMGLLGAFTTGIAHAYGYFKHSFYPRPPVKFSNLLSVFGIYLGYLFVLPILIIRLFGTQAADDFMTIQFFLVILMFATLLFYIRVEGSTAMKSAMKNPESSSSKFKDFGLGILIWLVAFPWVGVASQIFDLILKIFFNYESYEQVAVKYLKDNLQSTPQTIVALISIVIIAPIVEEILFRGTLQQYLKKFFSVKVAIALTAAIFACFHFSFSQGLGNFSLIPSLFIFACFLGYTYERQGSIFASIGLHLAFNFASSFQILFFPD